MTKRRWCGLLIVVIAAAACEADAAREDVNGRYRMVGGTATDELLVRSDGTYLHIYEARGGPVLTDSSSWTWETQDDGPWMTFNDFKHRSRTESDPGMIQPRGFWPVRVRKTWSGQIRLDVDPDDDWFYAKVKEP